MIIKMFLYRSRANATIRYTRLFYFNFFVSYILNHNQAENIIYEKIEIKFYMILWNLFIYS